MVQFSKATMYSIAVFIMFIILGCETEMPFLDDSCSLDWAPFRSCSWSSMSLDDINLSGGFDFSFHLFWQPDSSLGLTSDLEVPWFCLRNSFETLLPLKFAIQMCFRVMANQIAVATCQGVAVRRPTYAQGILCIIFHSDFQPENIVPLCA